MALPPLSPAVTISSAPSLPESLDRPGMKKLTLPISVQLADHNIRRMTDDRTSNARNISTQKRHPRLLQRIIGFLRLSHRSINIIDRRLKRRKLDHRIRNLPSPQRVQPLIQSPIPLLANHLPPPLPQRPRKRRQRRLHPHLYGLHGA